MKKYLVPILHDDLHLWECPFFEWNDIWITIRLIDFTSDIKIEYFWASLLSSKEGENWWIHKSYWWDWYRNLVVGYWGYLASSLLDSTQAFIVKIDELKYPGHKLIELKLWFPRGNLWLYWKLNLISMILWNAVVFWMWELDWERISWYTQYQRESWHGWQMPILELATSDQWSFVSNMIRDQNLMNWYHDLVRTILFENTSSIPSAFWVTFLEKIFCIQTGEDKSSISYKFKMRIARYFELSLHEAERIWKYYSKRSKVFHEGNLDAFNFEEYKDIISLVKKTVVDSSLWKINIQDLDNTMLQN